MKSNMNKYINFIKKSIYYLNESIKTSKLIYQTAYFKHQNPLSRQLLEDRIRLDAANLEELHHDFSKIEGEK